MFLILFVLFLLLQAIQPVRNSGIASGENDITQVVPVPDPVLSILKTSCFDCHSNRTVYPWYGNISPFNWWLAFHVEEGKQDVNFSIFGQYAAERQRETLEAIANSIKANEMPLPSYLWMHKEAILTDRQKQLLVEWAVQAQENISRR